MQCNVGGVDRLLRMVVGVALIVLAIFGFIGSSGYIGIVPLATGIFRFCPAYSLIGFKSSK